jgi:hypothetical protein
VASDRSNRPSPRQHRGSKAGRRLRPDRGARSPCLPSAPVSGRNGSGSDRGWDPIDRRKRRSALRTAARAALVPARSPWILQDQGSRSRPTYAAPRRARQHLPLTAAYRSACGRGRMPRPRVVPAPAGPSDPSPVVLRHGEGPPGSPRHRSDDGWESLPSFVPPSVRLRVGAAPRPDGSTHPAHPSNPSSGSSSGFLSGGPG